MGRSRPSPWRAFPESCEWVLLGVPRRPGCGSARSKGLLSSSVPVAIEDRDVSWGREALVVGATGFEPATVCSQSRCATRLRHAPPDTICSGSNSSWVAAASRAGRGRPERPERPERSERERRGRRDRREVGEIGEAGANGRPSPRHRRQRSRRDAAPRRSPPSSGQCSFECSPRFEAPGRTRSLARLPRFERPGGFGNRTLGSLASRGRAQAGSGRRRLCPTALP